MKTNVFKKQKRFAGFLIGCLMLIAVAVGLTFGSSGMTAVNAATVSADGEYWAVDIPGYVSGNGIFRNSFQVELNKIEQDNRDAFYVTDEGNLPAHSSSMNVYVAIKNADRVTSLFTFTSSVGRNVLYNSPYNCPFDYVADISIPGLYNFFMIAQSNTNFYFSNVFALDTRVQVELPSAPSKLGYNFVGWYYDADFIQSYDGAAIYEDTELYAKFTPIIYGITYNLNGGELSVPIQDYTVETDGVTLPTPSKTGHEFKGWFDNADFSGSAVTTIPAGSMGNKQYYALWEILTYKVSFYVDGEVYIEMTVNYGSTLTGFYLVDMQTFEIVPLYTSAELTAAFDLSTVITENKSVYTSSEVGVFVSLTYMVRGEELATDLLDYNTLLSNLRTAELAGYNFEGWYYDVDFAEPVFASDKLTRNLTIYAKMTPIDPSEGKTFIQKWWWAFAVGGGVLLVIVVTVLIARKKKR